MNKGRTRVCSRERRVHSLFSHFSPEIKRNVGIKRLRSRRSSARPIAQRGRVVLSQARRRIGPATMTAVRPRPIPSAPRSFAMPHTLPQLPYAFDALEPHIDAKTMEIHSQKHHKAYVDNLNKALESAPADVQNMDIVTLLRSIKSVPEGIRQAVINNGGGHHNHS